MMMMFIIIMMMTMIMMMITMMVVIVIKRFEKAVTRTILRRTSGGRNEGAGDGWVRSSERRDE